MGPHFRVAEKTSALRKKIAKIAQIVDAHPHEEECQFRGVGIFSKIPNPNDPADIELPPMGIDFAFDYGVEGKGVFFLRDGEWWIRREDVMYVDENRKKGNTGPHRSTRRRRAMRVIDKPKPAHLRNLTKHVSEDGWHLPTDHERHLLNFPQEILNNILRHILVKQGPGSVSPNWRSCYADNKLPIFNYSVYEGNFPTTTSNLRTDGFGPYYEVRAIHRSAIDATVLRTSKKLYRDGIDLLYSNKFLFFTDTDWPLDERPYPQADRIEQVLASLSDTAQQRAFLEELEREMYDFDFQYDHRLNTLHLCWGRPFIEWTLPYGISIPFTHWRGFSIRPIRMLSRPHFRSRDCLHWDFFLWFLWTIGSKNASRIKNLTFHSMSSYDLLFPLKCYFPYIKFFCVGLENMRIEVGWHDESEQPDTQAHPNCRRTIALKGLLKEIREIQSLRNLEVVDVLCRGFECLEADPASFRRHDHTELKSIEYAESTISWIKERSLERDHEKYLEDVSRDIHVASQEGDRSRMRVGMELLRWENTRKDIRRARAAAKLL